MSCLHHLTGHEIEHAEYAKWDWNKIQLALKEVGYQLLFFDAKSIAATAVDVPCILCDEEHAVVGTLKGCRRTILFDPHPDKIGLKVIINIGVLVEIQH